MSPSLDPRLPLAPPKAQKSSRPAGRFEQERFARSPSVRLCATTLSLSSDPSPRMGSLHV